jgi:dipeptidyl aminopeptidase/acylaminoacyl peptidase
VLHTIRPDGTHDRALTEGGFNGLSVSRDGSEVAFFGRAGLYRMNVDGSGRRLIRAKLPGQGQREPAWAPGGRRLAFSTYTQARNSDGARGSTRRIWVVRRDGTDLRAVARGDSAVWSRGGRYLLYAEEDGDIARIKPNGRRHRVLARHYGESVSLDLSPSGRRLAYHFSRRGTFGAPQNRTLNLRTGRRTSFEADYHPRDLRSVDLAWTPRGGGLTFISPSATADTYARTVRPDGTHVKTLFQFPGRPATGAGPVSIAWQTR